MEEPLKMLLEKSAFAIFALSRLASFSTAALAFALINNAVFKIAEFKSALFKVAEKSLAWLRSHSCKEACEKLQKFKIESAAVMNLGGLQ